MIAVNAETIGKHIVLYGIVFNLIVFGYAVYISSQFYTFVLAFTTLYLLYVYVTRYAIPAQQDE